MKKKKLHCSINFKSSNQMISQLVGQMWSGDIIREGVID